MFCCQGALNIRMKLYCNENILKNQIIQKKINCFLIILVSRRPLKVDFFFDNTEQHLNVKTF